MSLLRPRSLQRWLSRWLAVQTFIALGFISIAVYYATNLNLEARQNALIQQKVEVVQHLVAEKGMLGDSARLKHKLEDFFSGRPDFSLRLAIDGVMMVYGSQIINDHDFEHDRRITFRLAPPNAGEPPARAELALDITADIRLRRALAWTLFACSLIGAIVVASVGALLVRRALAPVDALGRQAASLSPDRMDERLDESGQSQEIQPLVRQFNAVLERLQRAYVQMEGFNADVAHEMRTPLATLVGETELALRTKPSEAALRDILGSNLEDLQRLTNIVRDMLFLSQADRGARVSGVWEANVASVIHEVVEFHEAEAADANVSISIQGNALADIDRTLFQRAISNLLSNAIRYADTGSTIEIAVAYGDRNDVVVAVTNLGEPIAAEHLPRLFHRFYRIDTARKFDANHHGLGLSIVNAIAQMHNGHSFAKSKGRQISLGFTVSIVR